MDSLPRPDQDYSCSKALERDTLAVTSPSHGMQSFQKATRNKAIYLFKRCEVAP
ncbi:hypothetical protein NC652_011178 [Populus alba x Populus x berolinensis]|uniref:Uncharacterized protein n=1 Tax=Populus alba x Populus x berolinensis TaxID=444605 RepID=A0AAD6R1R7_9ROSI|nr:hypothetical protein NC652_011178 [Populus alba x Populus x berolinensis]KAJ7000721.1 hypothetical protein NC653_011236 [Populus alba x Populus x berolinensis]